MAPRPAAPADHPVLVPLQIEYLSGGTPLTNQHYISSPHGEFYGIDHGIARLQMEAIATMRAETAVPNLYLTGDRATQMGTALGEWDGGEKTFNPEME